MQEDFLHYLWKYKKFDISNLQTVSGESIQLFQVGQHNFNAGPDFFNAQLKIGEQLWAGNVEIHIKSSDWYVHHHEIDPAYDNVILHVVWEHDIDIFRKDNTAIPTLVLSGVVPKSALNGYYLLFSKSQKWISCEDEFATVDSFVLLNWLERLFFERLERKAKVLQPLLEASKNDWEAVFFKQLAKNFGLKVNGEAFLSMASSVNFSVIRKIQSQSNLLEALFMGQSGLLNAEGEDAYYKSLQNDYLFLKQKFGLTQQHVAPLQFFRLRPPNFPTIRYAQLAQIYATNKNVFSKVMAAKTKEDLQKLFKVGTSVYWESHYTFNKISKSHKKITTSKFIDLLIINTIIPIKFSYAKATGKNEVEAIIKLIEAVKPEENSIISKFETLKPISKSALQTQALLQLKHEYCNYKKCLHCVVGNSILDRF